MIIILGIDPGSRTTGYGVISCHGQTLTHIASGCLRFSDERLEVRLKEIFSGVSDLMLQFKPNEVAIEDVFVMRNANSALKLGQARGAALVAIAKENVPLFSYAPRLVKKSVIGYGGADKEQMQRMVKLLLKLPELPKPDAADALAIALCHAQGRKLRKIMINC